MSTTTDQIGDILLKSKIVSKAQLSDALEINRATGLPISRILVDLGYASETAIIKRLAEELQITFVDLTECDIDSEALAAVPSELALRYGVLPLDLQEGKLTVAMDSPDNLLALDDLRIATGYEIEPAISPQSELTAALNQYYGENHVVEEVLERVGLSEDETIVPAEEQEEEGPVARLVDAVISGAVRGRASDIMLEPQEDLLRVRYRIDGVFHEVMKCPKKTQAGVISRLKIMGGMDIAERRLPQDGRFGMTVDSRAIDFRVASLPTVYGEQVVLRILEKDSILLELEDLGFLPETLERFRSSFVKPYGAIMVTGPTGSGKTTTLYSALNALNAPGKNIITVEDPVEYRLSGINQVQVNLKAGLTFSSALRSILRNDPDIVMIGEIRDRETALIAVESALTGHLVLSTLHTRDAAGALTRLTEMGVEPFLSSSAVDCVIAQRLARRLCRKCRQEYDPGEEDVGDVGFKFDSGTKLYRPGRCNACDRTGYKGRVGLYELLIVSEAIERLVVEQVPTEEIARQAQSEGSFTLRDDGFEKVKQGLTTIEEVLRVTT